MNKDLTNTAWRKEEDNEIVHSVIDKIRHSEFYDHDMLIYPDLTSFRKIYSECAWHALDDNEIVLIVTNYDPIPKVVDSLLKSGISVKNEMKKGNLFILDSLRTYQIDVQGALRFIKSLVIQVEKNKKSGIFNISDMGSFFVAERAAMLTEYEQSIPKKVDVPLKGFCSYHNSDFATLSKEQQERILSAHNRVVTQDKSYA